MIEGAMELERREVNENDVKKCSASKIVKHEEEIIQSNRRKRQCFILVCIKSASIK